MLTKRHLHCTPLLLLWVEGTLDRNGTNESHGEAHLRRIAKDPGFHSGGASNGCSSAPGRLGRPRRLVRWRPYIRAVLGGGSK